MSKTISLFVFILLILLACSKNQKTDTLFSLIPSSESGVTFSNTLTEDEKNNILAYEYFYNGGGVAIGDINNDGLPDIYFSANQEANRLYLNNGDFHFEDITEKARVSAKSGWRTGVAMVDINGDGWLDIYLCRSGDQHELFRSNSLYINNGDLTFTDKASEYGLNDKSYSTSSVFFDYDRDGDLDLFLLNHSRLYLSNSYDIDKRYANDRVKFVGNRLYRNDSGVFVEVSDETGIYGPVSNYGLGAAMGDIDNNGWPDLYLSNDYTEKDKLLLNNHGRFFRERSDSLLSQMSLSSMGANMADLNNDGWLDIISLDMLPKSSYGQKQFFWQHQYEVYQAMADRGLHHQYMRNMVHINNGNGTFGEIGQYLNMSNTDWSWAPLIADFDNDGNQDVFITNGFKKNFTSNDILQLQAEMVRQIRSGKSAGKLLDILDMLPTYATNDFMFQNMGNLKFKDVSDDWGFDGVTLSNGAAYADLDNDGDLDIVVNCIDGEAMLYRNNSESKGNNYLKVKLSGNKNNLSGLGSSITLYTDGKKMFRHLNPYGGYQSSMEPLIYFGLGESKMIDSLIIKWPDGKQQKLKRPEVNQMIVLNYGDAENPTSHGGGNNHKKYFKKTGTILFRHQENDFIDFSSQPLLPRMYSTQGPAAAMGDVNGDGLTDLFVGGAKGQPGKLFLQTLAGVYREFSSSIFEVDKNSEDIDAVFFDMDRDGDEDLYVVSGGNEFAKNDPLLQDRLYENAGGGKFVKRMLPDFLTSGSCVRLSDIDLDGDIDLFVGGRIVPSMYPATPSSSILLNDGDGNLSITASGVGDIGMVTDAAWTDLNGDRYPELIVVGEWMPVTVFENKGGNLTNATSKYIPVETEGWWNSILVEDFDRDGDQDFIAGNFGLNQQYKPSLSQPMELYYADYDDNGSLDPIINYYIGGESYPMPIRDELVNQLPSFKKRFPDYKSYSTAKINNILTEEEVKNSKVLKAAMFETCLFQNDNGKFTIRPLTKEAQFSPIYSMVSMDVNHDGHLDLITGGNLSAMPLRFGRVSANFGEVFLGDGKGGFRHLPSVNSGLAIRGDVRKILKNGNTLIFIRNNDFPLVYSINQSK